MAAIHHNQGIYPLYERVWCVLSTTLEYKPVKWVLDVCAHSLSHSSVHPFFLFVISCQPSTCHMEFHCNPNGPVCVTRKFN